MVEKPKDELNAVDFDRLRNFIYSNYGIKIPPAKKVMLQARLLSRMKKLNIPTYQQYCKFVFSENNSDEIIHMIDVVSTNKTDFFRESAHFDFLQHTLLPEFERDRMGETLRIWSAACSSGPELYTIAMVINEYNLKRKVIDYNLFGTDISSRMLERSLKGVYTEDEVAPVPRLLRAKYLMKSMDQESRLYRIVPELRSKLSVARLNLMDQTYPIFNNFNAIFCRNVLIYFDQKTQEKVVNRLCNHLDDDGYLFLGHSETIINMKVPLKQIRPTVYKKIL
jgi:chemotaxis protein methyltransferase CheR